MLEQTWKSFNRTHIWLGLNWWCFKNLYFYCQNNFYWKLYLKYILIWVFAESRNIYKAFFKTLSITHLKVS